ncbi:MAG: bifunctional riboflavin kinase/FAD synthetase [Saprospiraceae bacterium]
MNIYRNLKELPDFKNAVITIGSFDGVHRGHQKILSRMRRLAEEIDGDSIVITFHPHPRSVIDTSKDDISVLNTLAEKIELIESHGIKNLVVVPFSFEFSRLSPREYIEKFIITHFCPSYVVIGYDHKFGLNRGGDISLFREYEQEGHFKVIEIPKQEIEDIAISSTAIRKALLAGDVQSAESYLNRPYILSGKVIHGDKLGSKLGYPTANLEIAEKNKLIPVEGVYAVRIDIDQVGFEGMMYIGKRPSVSDQVTLNIEINIFDFNENIYDKTITIHILRYLRQDIKFNHLDELKEQLKVDEKNALIVLDEINQKSEQKASVTLAILNYNGVDLLESYLPMMQYSASQYDVDMLVIDNHSDDLSVDFVKEWYPEIRVIELLKNYGYAEGYNKGVREVETEFIAFINSDVLVSENWLDPLLLALESDKTIGLVQPTIMSMEEKNKFEYAGAAGGFIDILGYPFCRGRIFDTVENNDGQYTKDIDIFWASGAAMVCRTALFKSLGGFDGGFFAHQEEIDFCWRAQQAGFKIKNIADSKVYHLGGGTLDYKNPRKDFLNFRNNLYLLTKNESLTTLLWLIPVRLILDGLAAIKFVFDGYPKSALAVIKAHMSFYLHLPLVLERRNKEYHWINKSRIGKANVKARYQGSILWKYYIEYKRRFSELNI